MLRPELYQVYPHADYTVDLYYDNGEIRKYDCGALVLEPAVARYVRTPTDFIRMSAVLNRTFALDYTGDLDPAQCIDICPDVLYRGSISCEEAPQLKLAS
ncbi:MAG: DUF2442 domain-containing protein [Firmicutes bacterium]|nr:DUF2442 domain-containing protein [Bacillota bacterium]